MRYSSIKVAVTRYVRKLLLEKKYDLTMDEIDATIGLMMMRYSTDRVGKETNTDRIGKETNPDTKKEKGMRLRSGRTI